MDPNEFEFDDESAVEYLAPTTIEEALAMLAEHGDDAKVVAGAQSLSVFLRQGLLSPRYLIGLKRIPELGMIEAGPDGGLTIGAMVTQHELEKSALVRERATALSEAAATVASPLIRRQGTLGGNLVHADPTGDPPAALIALGAVLELRNANASRRLPVDEFFVDYMETATDSNELLTAVHLPSAFPRTGSAYLKHRVRGVDTALVGAAVGLTLSEDCVTCTSARIGLAGAGTTPVRAREAEGALTGQPLTDDMLRRAARVAADACDPLSDTEGSAWYRQEMIAVFVRRAAEIALARAKGAA